MVYNKKFLISELHRFVLENERNPKQLDMQIKFRYPSYNAYIKQFGSWNNALIEAGLELNQYHDHWQDGTETCDNCGKLKPGNQNWHYKNEQRLCSACYERTFKNYMNENLDPESTVGFGFIGQRVVAKALDLNLKNDCNCSLGFGAPHDLYDEGGYKYINVKATVLYKDNVWRFKLYNKQISDTYILLGFSKDKSNIEHIWITDSTDDLTFEKKSIGITNSERGLRRAEPWEVDCKPFNDAYHSMSLDNCSVLRSD